MPHERRGARNRASMLAQCCRFTCIDRDKPLKLVWNYDIVPAFAPSGPVPPNRLAVRSLAWLSAMAMISGVRAQDLCLPVPSTPVADPAPTDDPAEQRVEITAGHIELGADSGAELSEQIEIRSGTRRLTAERASIDPSGEHIEVVGRVTYQDADVLVYGEDAQIDAVSEEVTFARAGFDVPQRPARGEAATINIRNDRTVTLSSVSFTTCPAQQVDWELLASEIAFDLDGGVGTAQGVKFRFKGVPVFYSPFVTFPLDNQRKSGLLTPNFSERDSTGVDVSIPYYLNLAPNYDLTLEPRYMSKRGTQINSDFRYLLPSSAGQLRFEYLPEDSQTSDMRNYVNLQHTTVFDGGWQLNTGIEQISDEQYFEDLGSGISVTSQTHLNRYVDVALFRPSWSVLTRLQNYQTIDPQIIEADEPYRRVPQVLFEGRWMTDRFGFYSNSELVNFDHTVGVTGWRFDTNQEASVRFARAGMYLTPAVALRQTNYWLDQVDGSQTTESRFLPIGSIDSGFVLERDSTAGSWTQTLEPRLLYVHVPFEEQSDLPVFDTIEPAYNIVQLFRKYQFVGPDRIADSNQLSVGVTTRILDGANGREKLAATFGQTRYLTQQRVSLPGSLPKDANASDYVAELAVNLRETWGLNVGYQWNTTTEETARVETQFEYRPQADRLFGLGYRFREDFIEQGDLSVVWPATQRWRVVGRYSYSFLDNTPLEQFIGLEYEACCWRIRVIGREFISTRTGESDSSLLFQFELKGLSQQRPSPEALLDRGILGYQPMGVPGAQP
jgi:LPS-assembly protein